MNSIKINLSELRQFQTFYGMLINLIEDQNIQFANQLKLHSKDFSDKQFNLLSETTKVTITDPVSKYCSDLPFIWSYFNRLESSLIPYFEYYNLKMETIAHIVDIQSLYNLCKKSNALLIEIQSYNRNIKYTLYDKEKQIEDSFNKIKSDYEYALDKLNRAEEALSSCNSNWYEVEDEEGGSYTVYPDCSYEENRVEEESENLALEEKRYTNAKILYKEYHSLNLISNFEVASNNCLSHVNDILKQIQKDLKSFTTYIEDYLNININQPYVYTESNNYSLPRYFEETNYKNSAIRGKSFEDWFYQNQFKDLNKVKRQLRISKSDNNHIDNLIDDKNNYRDIDIYDFSTSEIWELKNYISNEEKDRISRIDEKQKEVYLTLLDSGVVNIIDNNEEKIINILGINYVFSNKESAMFNFENSLQYDGINVWIIDKFGKLININSDDNI
jgi:hypothetical protein